MSAPGDGAHVAGLLAEEPRLRAFAAVVLGSGTAGEVATAAGLDAREATIALERLAGGGLIVRGEGGRLEANVERLKEVARSAAAQRSAEVADDFSDASPSDAAVLRNFVRKGRLVQIPSSHKKRLVVLDWLSQRFEPGTRYSEAQVNLLLGMAHADVAALRRYLVDEERLERRDGIYWRAGGPILD